MTNRSHSANTRANAQRSDMVTWVGASCGRHGSYVFYKAFRFRISTEFRQSVSTSSVIVRSRSRERRHNQGDVTGTSEDKADDVTDGANREHSPDERILALGEFFFVQCRPEDPVCIGELQLLWHDKHSGQDLASTRLYYIPETTPAGRMSHQGKDEVLAVSEKIVMRTDDLSSWIVEPEEWNYGSSLPLVPNLPNGSGLQSPKTLLHSHSLLHSCVNMSDVKTERKALVPVNGVCTDHRFYEVNLKKENQSDGDSNAAPRIGFSPETDSQQQCTNCPSTRGKAQVLMLSLTAYCRHMAIMKRIEGTEQKWLSKAGAAQLLATFGAYTSDNPHTRLVFCRDTFDYPQLFEHDLICEELAPVFKGRPRKKTKKPNNLIVGKTQVKKTSALAGIRTGATNAENFDPLANKLGRDDFSSGRRSSSRRRSKRKSPQKAPYEDQFVAVAAKSIKRLRRGSIRTPTPVGVTSREKPAPASKSEPTSPAAEPGAEVSSNSVVEDGEAAPTSKSGPISKRKSKRRVGYRSTALSIAIKNSLVENHKVKDPEAASSPGKEEISKPSLERFNSSESSSSTSSTGSSGSSSPSPEPQASSFKAPSPTESSSSASNSNDPYGQLSPSPLDFSAIMTAVDDESIKELDLSTSDENMYLRGLSDGNLPENKSAFLDILNQFMRKRNTPIGRIPSLGFKKLDLWAFFKLSQEFGGYEMITAKRLWKHVYDRMGGNPSCTSAATCTRKHFEKLLLPLEKYLRKTLRRKEVESSKSESDEQSKTPLQEVYPEHSPLNGRTFNGDAYFHNGAKISSSAPIPDTPKPTSTPELNPDVTCEPKIPSSPELPPITRTPPSSAVDLKSSDVMTNRIVHQSAAIITAAASIMNFESLADSVIRDELRTNRQSKSDGPRDVSTENVAKAARSKTTKPLQSSDVIDLTGPQVEKVSPGEPVTHQRFPQSMTAPSKPPTASSLTASLRPPALPVFTHCPRLSMAPPPYVPTKSSTPKLDTLDQPTVRSSFESSHPCRDKIPDQSERFSTQKRPLSGDKDQRTPSPISPKRPRPVSLLTTPSPSNRSYDIRNLMSIPTEGPTSRVQNKGAPPGEKLVRDPLVPEGQWDVAMQKAFETRSLLPQRPDYRYPLKEHPRYDSDRDRRLPPDRQSVYSERRNPIVTSQSTALSLGDQQLLSFAKRASPPPRNGYPPERSQPKGYYRPNSMLKAHREEVKRQQHSSVPNEVIKQEPHTDRRHNDERSSRRLQDDVVISRSHHHRSSPMRERHNAPRSPKMVLQRLAEPTDRKPFSSSFTVDRLTSGPGTKPVLPNGAHPLVLKQEIRNPHPTKTLGSNPHAPHPNYLDHRQAPYRPQSGKDGYRVLLPSNAPLPPRKEEALQRHEKARWGLDKDPHNRLNRVQNLPTKASNSVPDKPPSGHSGRASINDVPSSHSGHNRPFVLQDCPPTVIDPIILQQMKVIGASMPPGGAPPGLSRAPVPALQEALLQQQLAESTLRLSNHQEQQAAARGLAMMANPNPILAAAPSSMASALHLFNAAQSVYAQAASLQLRQMQEVAAASGAASNKHVITPELLSHLAQPGMPQVEYRNGGLLIAPPQLPQHITPEAAAALALTYVRR